MMRLHPVIAAAFLLLIITGVRWWSGGYDFSYFVTAGSEFVDANDLKSPIIVQEGPGYDGQFFYAYALSPFTKKAEGIEIDHPAYRHQRLLYPLLGYLLAFGRAEWLPFTLVLVNLASILLTCYLLNLLCQQFGMNRWLSLYGCLTTGILMSLGRDLAEPLEMLLLTCSFFCLLKGRTVLFGLSCTLCLFTRESSAMLLLPMAMVWVFFQLHPLPREEWFSTAVLKKCTLVLIGFPLLFYWKLVLFKLHDSPALVEGSNNLGLPFLGIFQGIHLGFAEMHGMKEIVEMLVWILNFSWIVALAWFASKCLRLRSNEVARSALSWAWLSGLVTALLFTYSIYRDDWSFVRVLSGFCLLSFLLMIQGKTKVPKLFVLYTFALFAIMTGRLWLRV